MNAAITSSGMEQVVKALTERCEKLESVNVNLRHMIEREHANHQHDIDALKARVAEALGTTVADSVCGSPKQSGHQPERPLEPVLDPSCCGRTSAPDPYSKW